MPAAALLSLVPQIANTVTQTIDAGKRRNFEQALASLNASQQQELNKQLASAKLQTDREAILANAIANIQGTKIQQDAIKSKQQANVKIALIIGGSVVVLGLIAIIIFKQSKKK